ncbi:MAG: response regulator [Lutibacter sp.]|nr:response regulator [Lutibacter sp.]
MLGYELGLAKFNPQKQQFEAFTINNSEAVTSPVRVVCEDFKGNLWIGTYEGLYILNSEKSKISYFKHNENEPNSLSQNSVYQIIEDSKGDIWIGTYAGGVNYYDRSFDLFKHFTTGTNTSKLSYKVVSVIIEDPDQNLWIGTEGGGINFYNRKTGVFDYYQHNKNNANSLSTNNVKSMIRTRNGNFWIGTHNGGLNFLNPKIKPFKFEKYKNTTGDSNGLSNNRVISLYEDYQNNIWIGTSGGGLNVMNVATKSITRIPDPSGTISSLVYNISKTSNRDTLLIAGDNGLVKFNIKTQKFIAIDYRKNQNVNNFNATLCVYEDPAKNIWIATEGDGLYYYNSISKKSIKYGINEGLPNEVIYTILPADSNTLWFSTNKGLSRLNLKTNEFKNFNASDGLIGDEFNFGAYIKLQNGNLMFGGTSGIDFFNPKIIKENSFIPPVSITEILVNNKPFLAENKTKKEITLEHNQNVFSFNFIALSYSQPEKNQYAYKLEGFDKEWNYIENKKSATYTNLDAGKYLFKVKASNSDGVWNEQGASIIVTILPAPWRTWWAYLLYFSIFLLILYFIRRIVLIRIKDRNELKNEKLEKEKLEEVNKLKLELFTNISHEFRTPLTLILGPVTQLLNIENNNSFFKEKLDTIQRNTKVLLQLINELLDFRKNESGKLNLKASKSNIIPFIENIKLSFEELAIQKKVNYKLTSTNKNIEVWFDKFKMKKILFNLISNAFKFTNDGNDLFINISTTSINETSKEPEFVKIDIINFVTIIPEEHIKFIFERFYQLDQKEMHSGSGIGLSLTKSLIELHKGKIEVNSSAKDGTCFSVYIPLGKEHLSENECITDFDENDENIFSDKPVFIERELKNNEILANTAPLEFNKELLSLLVVEDNIEVRTFIKSIFSEKYNVFEANNGQEGIEVSKEHPIDLIISDVMMPLMDGFEMCKEIKSNITTSHIPVILLTAKTSSIHQKEGYNIGADAYITKPFDANILEVRVNNLLNTRRNLISKFKKDIILEPKELVFTSADELFLEKAIKIVEENISDPEFNVNLFTDHMNMSRSVIFRKLKALTDQSINEFIRNIKLKRAAQYLAQTKMNVSQIAYEVGFNDLKYFRTCFKNQFNETPSTYRNKNASNSNDVN